MTLTDLYMEKQAKFGLAVKPLKFIGLTGAGLGALRGGLRAKPNENAGKKAIKEGLVTGISAGIISGLTVGQAVKHGKKVVNYLEKVMKVV